MNGIFLTKGIQMSEQGDWLDSELISARGVWALLRCANHHMQSEIDAIRADKETWRKSANLLSDAVRTLGYDPGVICCGGSVEEARGGEGT